MLLVGPVPQTLAATAVAFREASQPEFQTYAHRIVENAQTLAEACLHESLQVLTNGTDNHLLLLDVAQTFGLTGRQAESALRACHVTLNRNALPFDANGPWYTSGLRLGTPALTTLGMGGAEMQEIAAMIHRVLSNTTIAVTSKGEQSRAPSNLPPQIAPEVPRRLSRLLPKSPAY